MSRFFVLHPFWALAFFVSFGFILGSGSISSADDDLPTPSDSELLLCTEPDITVDLPIDYATVQSGPWNDLETWGLESGSPPSTDDYVQIRHRVEILGDSQAAGILIDSGAELWSVDSRSSVFVTGSVINHGTIRMLSIDMLGGSGVVVNTGVWNAMTYQKNADYTFSGGGTIDHFNATNGGGTISGCPVFENFGGEVITIPEGSAVQTKSASGANTFGNGKLIISGDSVSDGNEVRGNILHLIFSGSGQRLSFSTIQAREVHFVNGSKIITSHSDDFGAEPPTAERFVIHPGSSLKNPEGRHVYILGNIENYGQISDMNLHTIGSIKNNGEWTGGTLGLTGVTPRYITGSNPIMTSVTIFESFPLLNPHVIFGGSFGVTTGKSILFSPDDTFLTDPENDTDTYIVELLGPVSGNIIAEMADGKELDPSDSTEIRISGSAGEQNIQADLSADTIRISGGTKRLYRQTFSGDLIIEPSASLFNWKSNWSELTHFGDIVNKGSIIGESNGYAFYMDLYGDAENQGIWRNAKVRLKGNEDRLLDGVFDSDVSIGSEEFVITGYPVFAKNLSVSNHLLVGKNDDETDAALTFTGNNTFSDIDVRGADETVSAILIFAGSSQGFDNEIHADTIVFASPISSSSSTKTMYSPKLYGDVFVEEGVVVQDYSSSYARMMVYGDIHNNGIIRNRTSGGDSYWWQLYAENDGNIFTGKNAEWRSERIVAYWNNKEKGTYQYAFTQDPEKVKSHDPQDWEKFENTKYASLSVKDEVLSGEPWYWAWREKTGEDANGNIIWSAWNHRTINVPEENNTPPQLTLLGEEVITLSKGDEFTDSGVTANDAEDGDITDQVTTTYEYAPNAEAEKVPADGIDTSLVGEFTITYSVTDSGGLSAEVSRTVSILPAPKLEFSEEPDFNGARGVNRVKATANEEPITFKVVYTDETEPSGVKVEAVVTEEIGFTSNAYLQKIDIESVLNCPLSFTDLFDFEKRLLGCNGQGIKNDARLRISSKGEPKEQFSFEIIPGENTSLMVKLTALNSAGIEVAKSEQAIITGSGDTDISVSSNNKDIQKVEISLVNYISGEIFIKSVSLTDSYVMNPENEVDDINFAAGETYYYHKHFSKGKYLYQFRANNGSALTTEPEEPLRFETGYSNVVFLPGIQGSRLYDENSNQRWEPQLNSDVKSLFMELYKKTVDGKIVEAARSINQNIYTKKIIGEIWYVTFNIYESFIQDLKQWKLEGIMNEYVIIPYDWRLDYDDILSGGEKIGDGINYNKLGHEYIYNKIEEAIASSANGKITLVAHSMGGLIAKRMFANLKRENSERGRNILENTENFIMVASPQLGTPKAIASLLHAQDQQQIFGVVVDDKSAREFGSIMPAGYGLLPSEKYIERVKEIVDLGDASSLDMTRLVVFRDSLKMVEDILAYYFLSSEEYPNGNVVTYIELKKLLLDTIGRVNSNSTDMERPIALNKDLLENSRKLHEDIDNWTPPPNMKVYQVAGWGIADTIWGMEYKGKLLNLIACNKRGIPTSPGNLFCYDIDYEPLFTFDGDDTVVVPSAIAMRDIIDVETYFTDIQKYNSDQFDILGISFTTRNHGSIFEIDDIRNFVYQVVLKKPLDIRENEEDTNYDSKNFKYMQKNQPIETEPYVRLALHSPVSIDIYDADGNRTGATYEPENPDEIIEIVEQIPNSYFMEFGEGKYLGIPADQEYRIELKGLDHGTFTFEMEEVIGDEVIHSKLFEDIPTSPSMKAEMTVETLEESTHLTIDADGDGEEDISLTGEEGDEEQAIVASMIILQKMIEQMDMKSFLKKQLVHDLDKAIKFLEKGNSKQAVKELEQMIKRIELQLFKDKKLIDIRNGYIERITKQKEQLEKILRERLAKHFGSKWEVYWQKYEERFHKRMEAIKKRYKPTISEEDAQLIILYANQIIAKLDEK